VLTTRASVTEALRAFLAISVQLGLHIHHVDFITAYLNGDLDVDIYMHTPDGYQDRFGHYVRLRKALYGLRQAGRKWYELLHALLTELGFERINVEHGMYRNVRKDGEVMFVCIYVDDLPIASSSLDWIAQVKAELANRFKMKDLGPAKRILGIDIDYDQPAGILTLGQETYVESVLKEREMSDCRGVGSPIDPGQAAMLGSPEDLETADASRSSDYLSQVGEVLYLSQSIFLPIAYVASRLAQFSAKPTKTCWEILHRVHRWLRKHSTTGLVYRRNPSAPPLVGYSDSDWVGDRQFARSTGSYIFLLFGMPIAWTSKRQRSVASSTMQAEIVSAFYAIHEGLRELLWLRMLLNSLDIPVPNATTLYCDNQAAIQWCHSRKFHSASKQIHYRYHALREWADRGVVDFKWISTDDQLADIGTKALTVARSRDLSGRLGFTGMDGSGGTIADRLSPSAGVSDMGTWTASGAPVSDQHVPP
jgi:hypothetical protein